MVLDFIKNMVTNIIEERTGNHMDSVEFLVQSVTEYNIPFVAKTDSIMYYGVLTAGAVIENLTQI